jgi:phosphate ABC transporter permease protein PstC
VDTLAVPVGAALIGVVFSLALAIVLTQFSPPGLSAALKPIIELLAGIPSVVYGFVGVVTLVPLIRHTLGGPGLSVLAASIVLGVMILPTITSIAIDALQAVPRSYLEGAIALGATRWQTVTMVLLRAARSGLIAAVILGMGRAIGETMAVIMVAANALEIPHSLREPVRTLTSNIALEMGYASGDHRQALFATGVTLFVLITLLNIAALTISRRQGGRGRFG